MRVAVGLPLKTSGKPQIALLVFAPGRDPVIIEKQHLHPDELPYFSSAATEARGATVLECAVPIGVAICHDITVAAHADALVAAGAALYLASVAKTPRGVLAATATLAETARRHGIPVLMVNSVGRCEGKRAGGGSVVIGPKGRIVRRLAEKEALLTYDTLDGRTSVYAIAP